MGFRYEPPKDKRRDGPAPCTYDLEQYSIGKGSQSAKIGTEKRIKRYSISFAPGPGAYVTRSLAFEYEKPRFYMGTKFTPLTKNTIVPGAGTYDPSLSQTTVQFPKISMKIKLGSALVSKSFSPGPGNYHISYTNRKSSPRYGFGTSTRETG